MGGTQMSRSSTPAKKLKTMSREEKLLHKSGGLQQTGLIKEIVKANPSFAKVMSIILKSLQYKLTDQLVNLGDKEKATPLWHASINGQREIVMALINNGADVNLSDISGAAPLHVAAEMGHQDVVELLLTKKAEIDKPRYDDGQTPLHRAIQNQHYNVVETLVKKGASLHVESRVGTLQLTPLQMAEKIETTIGKQIARFIKQKLNETQS